MQGISISTRPLLRLNSRPKLPADRVLSARRDAYFRSHAELMFPAYDSPPAREIIRSVWSDWLGFQVERARDLDTKHWEQLKRSADRVRFGRADYPQAIVDFKKCERQIKAIALIDPKAAREFYREPELQ